MKMRLFASVVLLMGVTALLSAGWCDDENALYTPNWSQRIKRDCYIQGGQCCQQDTWRYTCVPNGPIFTVDHKTVVNSIACIYAYPMPPGTGEQQGTCGTE